MKSSTALTLCAILTFSMLVPNSAGAVKHGAGSGLESVLGAAALFYIAYSWLNSEPDSDSTHTLSDEAQWRLLPVTAAPEAEAEAEAESEEDSSSSSSSDSEPDAGAGGSPGSAFRTVEQRFMSARIAAETRRRERMPRRGSPERTRRSPNGLRNAYHADGAS